MEDSGDHDVLDASFDRLLDLFQSHGLQAPESFFSSHDRFLPNSLCFQSPNGRQPRIAFGVDVDGMLVGEGE